MMKTILKALLVPVAFLKAGKDMFEKCIHRLVDKLIFAGYVVLGIVVGMVLLAIF